MTTRRSINSGSLLEGVDLEAVLLYLLIVLIGWISITAASYNEEITSLFSFKHYYIKQAIWVGLAFTVGLFVLLIDSQYYHRYAYPLYLAGLGVLLLTLVAGSEKNGAKAWFELGSFAIQPIEFVKIATALALARLMSEYSFSITKVGDIIKSGLIICAPLLIVILQNDTGSGIVLGSFLMVFYREGLNKWLCIPVLLVATLFILSFVLPPLTLLVALLLVCVLSEMMITRQMRSRLGFLAAIFLMAFVVQALCSLFWPGKIDFYMALLMVSSVAALGVAIYAFRAKLAATFITLALFVGSIIFLPTTNYLFNSVLKSHQQDRILSFLGVLDDPRGADFNVRQAKIAIGSGGVFGKGFLESTQIKNGFVPEKHTDFIFCTLGEEWGFMGTSFVLALFCLLILKLMRMGERQEEPFGRIYCYCVASILMFHVLVNIGMTIGLMPVMGIPLPFMSYGGSSLIAFTIMLFIAIRLDASTRSVSFHN